MIDRMDWSWPNSTISRVIDGDTVEATLSNPDVGFGSVISFPVRLRLNRINADPVRTERGFRCKSRVLALTAGVRLTVITGKGYKYGAPPGKAGEWMAEIILADGRNLSDLLVDEGLAVAWDGTGARPDNI